MLHHSCARCRDKKIRCDGSSPCANCVNGSVASQCQRAQRKVRRRKEPNVATATATAAASVTASTSSLSRRRAPPSPPPSQLPRSQQAQSELQHPEHLQQQQQQQRQQQEQQEQQPQHPALYQHAPYRTPLQRAFDGERFRDEARSDRLTSASPLNPAATTSYRSSSHNTPTAASDNWNSPSRSDLTHQSHPIPSTSSSEAYAAISVKSISAGRRLSSTLLQQARRTIGNLDAAQRLLDTSYYYRGQSLTFSCVHLPSIKAALCGIFAHDEAAEAVGEDQLAVLLMALAISIQFTPHGIAEASQQYLIEAMGADLLPLQRQHALHSLATSILQRLVFGCDVTLQQIQACILVVVYDLDNDGFKDQLLLHAMRCAEVLKIDHIPADAPITVETEMMVRAWWFLVCRDWFAASHKGSYRINPSHFSTRQPLIIGDQVLMEAVPGSAPASLVEKQEAWLPVSCTQPLIQLASVMRQLADDKLHLYHGDALPFEKVEEAFGELVDSLPQGFRLDETYTPSPGSTCLQRLSAERWLVHQIIFAAFLDFYEVRLGEPVSRQAVALSNHILDMQSRLRHRCDVSDSLRVNVDGVVRAVTLICTDLMYQSREGGSGLVRQITLGRVREAISRCQARSSARRADFEFVSALLEAEARLWSQQAAKRGGGGGSSGSVSIASSSSNSVGGGGSRSSSSRTGSTAAPFTPTSVAPSPLLVSSHHHDQASPATLPPPSLTGSTSASAPKDPPSSVPLSPWTLAPAHPSGTAAPPVATGPTDADSGPLNVIMAAEGIDWTNIADFFPRDTGLCPALHSDSAVVDQLWDDVVAFLDQPAALPLMSAS